MEGARASARASPRDASQTMSCSRARRDEKSTYDRAKDFVHSGQGNGLRSWSARAARRREIRARGQPSNQGRPLKIKRDQRGSERTLPLVSSHVLESGRKGKASVSSRTGLGQASECAERGGARGGARAKRRLTLRTSLGTASTGTRACLVLGATGNRPWRRKGL